MATRRRTSNAPRSKAPPFPKDVDSRPPNYNEPPQPRAADRFAGQFTHAVAAPGASSLAWIRLEVERLLSPKCASTETEAWSRLGQQAVGVLMRIAGDAAEAGSLRQRAIATLGQLRAPAGLGVLGQVLADPDEPAINRIYAASGLGDFESPETIPMLVGGIRDADAAVRRQVARALGRVGTPEAAAYLTSLCGDPSPAVVEVATKYLGAIKKAYDLRTGVKIPKAAAPKKVRAKPTPALERDTPR